MTYLRGYSAFKKIIVSQASLKWEIANDLEAEIIGKSFWEISLNEVDPTCPSACACLAYGWDCWNPSCLFVALRMGGVHQGIKSRKTERPWGTTYHWSCFTRENKIGREFNVFIPLYLDFYYYQLTAISDRDSHIHSSFSFFFVVISIFSIWYHPSTKIS